MNARTLLSLCCAVLCTTLTGCVTDKTAVQPIPLQDALSQILDGIDGFVAERNQRAAEKGLVYPYVPSEAEVTLSLATSRTEAGGISIAIVPNALITEVGGEWSVETTREAGNTLTITLQNLFLADTGTWIADSKTKSPEEIAEVMKAMTGFQTFMR